MVEVRDDPPASWQSHN